MMALGGPVMAEDDMPLAATLPYPKVEIVTSEGTIVVMLNRPRAPRTVENFIRYVLDGHYDGTIIHRVVEGFVIQGGGYTPDFEERATRDPVVNESGNGLSNARGTIAMARQEDPHTAQAQWFINLADNENLDPNRRRWGYAVFGRVEEGMDVVDAIGAVETGPGGSLPGEVPQDRILIERVRVLDE